MFLLFCNTTTNRNPSSGYRADGAKLWFTRSASYLFFWPEDRDTLFHEILFVFTKKSIECHPSRFYFHIVNVLIVTN